MSDWMGGLAKGIGAGWNAYNQAYDKALQRRLVTRKIEQAEAATAYKADQRQKILAVLSHPDALKWTGRQLLVAAVKGGVDIAHANHIQKYANSQYFIKDLVINTARTYADPKSTPEQKQAASDMLRQLHGRFTFNEQKGIIEAKGEQTRQTIDYRQQFKGGGGAPKANVALHTKYRDTLARLRRLPYVPQRDDPIYPEYDRLQKEKAALEAQLGISRSEATPAHPNTAPNTGGQAWGQRTPQPPSGPPQLNPDYKMPPSYTIERVQP